VEIVRTKEIAEVWRESPVSSVRPGELVLVTDFDGTLAEVVTDPLLAVALPDGLAALRRLVHLLGNVIVLSSRTNPELERLVPIPGLRLIGDSGLALSSPAQKRALERFNAEAAHLLAAIPGAWIEIKPASSAIHYRNAQASGAEVLALLRPLIDETGLDFAAGRKVIEVHWPQEGKGSALTALLPQLRPGGVACFGDDENDRSMFEVVSGLAIPHMCVGVDSAEAPPGLFDRCDLVVSGPPEAAAVMTVIVDWAANS
jgi:trehalose 6-phosphate phosphatase